MASKWLQRLRAFESEFYAYLNQHAGDSLSASKFIEMYLSYEYSGERNADVMRTFLIAEAILVAGEDFRTTSKDLKTLVELWNDLQTNEIQSDDQAVSMEAVRYLAAAVQSWMDLRLADAASQLKAVMSSRKTLPESWKARIALISGRLMLRLGRMDEGLTTLNELILCEFIPVAMKARIAIAEHLQLAGDSAGCAAFLSDEFFQSSATQDQLLRAEWLVLVSEFHETKRARVISQELQLHGRHRNFQTNLEGLMLSFSKRLSEEVSLLAPESARKTLRSKDDSERIDALDFYSFVLSAHSAQRSNDGKIGVADVLKLELMQNKILDYYQHTLAVLVVQTVSSNTTAKPRLATISPVVTIAKANDQYGSALPQITNPVNKPMQKKILSRELFVSTFALRASAKLLKIRLKKLVDRDVDLNADITSALAELVATYAGMMRGPLMKLAQMANFFGFALPSATRERLHDLFDNSRFFSSDKARDVVEAELGKLIEDVFKTWIDRPIACASVAQVHKAQLHNGDWVAVKILHPDFDAMLRSDMRMIKSILPLMRWLFPHSDASAHFQKNFESLENESDFNHEASVMRKFREHFAGDPLIHVPKVVDELSSRRILVMEFVDGTSFRQFASVHSVEERAASVNTIHRFIGKSMFEMGMINPDMHPGNFIFLRDGRVSFIDLGMSNSVDTVRAKLYRDLLNAATDRNTEATKEALIALGFADEQNNQLLVNAVHAAFVEDEHGLLMANDQSIRAIQELFSRTMYSQLKSPLPASDFLVPRAIFTFMNTVRELMGSTAPRRTSKSATSIAS
jgi:predicted unusual protein kinase regulating ubiquinone biosynthesis (AarF/ABC1/UbiB family)